MASAPQMNHTEWSLPVPSVQELAIQQPAIVPNRYHLRDDMGDIIIDIVPSADPSLCVPLIDMAKLVNPDSGEGELQRLHAACKEWGVFQLINHGVSDELLRNMKEQARDFFDLPLQEKKRWVQKPGNIEGYGQAFVLSEEQKLQWNDMIFLRTLPTEIRKLNLWPDNPKKFRETLESYSEDMRKVAGSIAKYIAMGLELDAEEISKAYRAGKCDVRMNIYPPCPEPEKVIGMVPHADVYGITLLLECGNMPGLQFLKDSQWVYVVPIEGAITVNLGLIMEIMSNGIYKAPEHRAVVNRLRERLSIVTFCDPDSSVDVGPAKQLLTKSGSPPLYKTLTYSEYRRRFSDWKLDVPFIELLKI